jgi:FRG domain
MPENVRERSISSWRELRDVLEDLSSAGFAFRGQANVVWPLDSSLTRYLKTYVGSADEWMSRENKILHTFKRRAHLLLPRTPDEGDTLEWLALMQHHGAPTRLLDFTWSPYVAAFFALEKAAKDDAAIWAISSGPAVPNLRGYFISQILNEVLEVRHSKTRELVVPNSPREEIGQVVMGEPVLMNQRMTTQAGTFIIPTKRLDVPVEALVPGSSVLRLRLVTQYLRKQTMEKLHNMNINNATLFPGIDGLARSLAFELEFKWKIDPQAAERVMADRSALLPQEGNASPEPGGRGGAG